VRPARWNIRMPFCRLRLRNRPAPGATSRRRSWHGRHFRDWGTSDKIDQLVTLYPEIFQLAKLTDDGSTAWYAFDPCPFSGETHNAMGVGKGKSCITLRSDGNVGFKCFHDACAHATFLDVLKRAKTLTGRACGIRFWAEMDEEEFESALLAWGGVDDLST
jgi:hypothetical protein